MAIENVEIRIAQKAKASCTTLQTELQQKEFKNFLKGLPGMLTQNGLLQTLTYLEAKEGTLFKEMQKFYNSYFGKHNANLISDIVGLDNIDKYILYQNTLLTYAIWLKRFSQAL